MKKKKEKKSRDEEDWRMKKGIKFCKERGRETR